MEIGLEGLTFQGFNTIQICTTRLHIQMFFSLFLVLIIIKHLSLHNRKRGGTVPPKKKKWNSIPFFHERIYREIELFPGIFFSFCTQQSAKRSEGFPFLFFRCHFHKEQRGRIGLCICKTLSNFYLFIFLKSQMRWI